MEELLRYGESDEEVDGDWSCPTVSHQGRTVDGGLSVARPPSERDMQDSSGSSREIRDVDSSDADELSFAAQEDGCAESVAAELPTSVPRLLQASKLAMRLPRRVLSQSCIIHFSPFELGSADQLVASCKLDSSPFPINLLSKPST